MTLALRTPWLRVLATMVAAGGLLAGLRPAVAEEYFPETVAQLIAAIEDSNTNGQDDVIHLGGLTFTLEAVHNETGNGANGLPIIRQRLTIQNGTIERSSDSPVFRVLHVEDGSHLTLKGVTIRGGREELGGGILKLGNGPLEILDGSVIEGNEAIRGAGIEARVNVVGSVVDSTIRGNTANIAPAIYIEGALELLNSTVTGNHVVGTFQPNGAVFAEFLPIRVVNSTFSDNSGGGIVLLDTNNLPSNPPSTVVNSTFIDNGNSFFLQHFGVRLNNSRMVLRNTLIANVLSDQFPNNCAIDADSELISEGHNLSDDATCDFSGTGDQDDAAGARDLIDDLAANGGPTLTHALLEGSTAIDGVGDGFCEDEDGNPVTEDQRREPRPSGSTSPALCDIGAFELQADISAPVLTFDPAGLDFGDIKVGTVSDELTATLNNTGDAPATGLAFDLVGSDFDADTGDCGTNLDAGASCTVGITFAPTAPGPAAGALTVGSDEQATASLDLAGNGVSIPPWIDVDPDSLASVLGTDQMETRALTIANLGGESLEWEVTEEAGDFERVDAIALGSGESSPVSAVIDPAGEFAYFGTGTSPGRVVKVDLETFERVAAIPLESGEESLRSAVIDASGEFAYFGTDTTPGRVVKVDLATFERVDAITLESGESQLFSAVIDPTGDFAYFGTHTSPGRVVKIDLGTFERVDAVTLESGENIVRSAVMDPAGELAYFGMGSNPGRVVKVDLETFERLDAITLESGEAGLSSAVIDPNGEIAYFGTATTPGRVVKVDLDTFERVSAITLDSGENTLFSAAIDPAGELAYFGTSTVPGRVVKLDLDSFVRVDAVTLESGEDQLFSAAIDPTGDFAYFGTNTSPGRVVKIAVRGPDCALPAWSSVDPVSGSLPGGGEEVVDVTFDATGLAPGLYEATLCLSSNDPLSPLTTVPLELTVLEAPELAFDPASLDFGDVEVGTVGDELTATLHNTGAAPATELDFGLPGGDFTADTGDCGASLDAGASCTVSVIFAPTATGPAAATLEAASAEGAAASLDLAGNGTSETDAFTAVALVVDPEPLASDGNGVFEPGEIVDVAPAWRHDGTSEQSLSGSATDLAGPAGPTYDILASEAEYGLVLPGETATCRDTGVCYQMDIGPVGVERPATHWDAMFLEVVSDDTSHTWTLHLGDSFVDVPRTSGFYPSIETLLHHGITGGCTATQYCPAGINTRAQMPVFVLRALKGADYLPPACEEGSERFGDVPFSHPFCPWIEELARRGVVSGCGGGNYCLGDPMTRAQMSVFLLRTLEGPDYTPPPCAGRFADVACPSSFADWIEDLYDREVTSGCGSEPLRYCPANPVNRQQMAIFVTRTFGLTLYGP